MSITHSVRRTVTEAFTVVELLIVVVIIAILAAITIVTYSGIQQRASNTATINSVAAYAKAVQMYAVQNGAYPDGSAYPCLGGVGTRCANVTDSTSVSGCYSYGTTQGQEAFDTALKTVATTLPPPSTKSANCAGKQFAGAFYTTSGGQAYFHYFLLGNVSCGTPAGMAASTTAHIDSVTVCIVIFPAVN